MEDEIRKIGVLTGGGDAPGLNAVIRAVVKTAINDFGWEILGIEDGYEGLLLPDKTRPLSFDEVRGILPRGGTILGTTNRSNPFQYKIEREGQVEVVDYSDTVIKRAGELGLDAVVAIGGDGSMRLTLALIDKGLRAVGVPKTIDNDIRGTDVTFGFDTAVNTAMEALDKLHTTAESHHRVMVLEVMGRDAGWIALKSGISGGADVILIPEIPYELDAIADKIYARSERGANFSLIVVAEGAHPVGGKQIYQEAYKPGEQPHLGGIGEELASDLRECCNMEIRVIVLGHLLRGGSPSAFDRTLASRFGTMAVHLIAQGKLGHMVALQGDEIGAIPIAEAAVGQKLVPLESDLLLTTHGLGICLGKSSETLAKIITNIKTS